MEQEIKNLKAVTQILSNHDIDCWIDNGTLLGAVRNHSFIPWDKDMDIAAFYDNEEKVIRAIEDLKTKNYSVLYNPINAILTVIFKDSWNINLVLYNNSDDYFTSFWVIYDYGNLIVNNIRIIFNLTANYKRLMTFSRLSLILLDKLGYVKQIQVPKHFFQSWTQINLCGTLFRCPLNPEKYLQFRYGKTWRVPSKNWRYYLQDGALKNNEV